MSCGVRQGTSELRRTHESSYQGVRTVRDDDGRGIPGVDTDRGRGEAIFGMLPADQYPGVQVPTLIFCQRMRARITLWACGQNQTDANIRPECVDCKQPDKAPKGKRGSHVTSVPVRLHKKWKAAKHRSAAKKKGAVAEQTKAQDCKSGPHNSGAVVSNPSRSTSTPRGKKPSPIERGTKGRATGKDAPRPKIGRNPGYTRNHETRKGWPKGVPRHQEVAA